MEKNYEIQIIITRTSKHIRRMPGNGANWSLLITKAPPQQSAQLPQIASARFAWNRHIP